MNPRLCPISLSHETAEDSAADQSWDALEDADVLPHAEVIGDEGAVDEVAEVGSSVQVPIPIPEPPKPSKREVDIHNLTHATYRSWCKACVAGRRPNAQHRSRLDDRRRV